jgi:D-alanyl-D-alanine carboxypeptidase
LAIACAKDEVFTERYYECSSFVPENAPGHLRSSEFESLLSSIVSSGVPGMMLTVHDSQNGYWSGVAGLADLGSGVSLEPCNITRVGSTVKTFTAVSILLLQEDGLLNIDDPITDYLTTDDIRGIKNAKLATVRQLLQHSSGIFNYIQSLQFQTASLNDLAKTWQPKELVDYARGKDSYFSPGSDVRYSNTGYVLLGMIIEHVTGKPFYRFFEERIFEPLQMNFTRFAAQDPIPDGIIRGYVDLYSNLQLINATNYSGWDYFTADGGLISNAYDLNLFLTSLVSGKLLSSSSLDEMMTWQLPSEQDPEEFPLYYGLGIFKIETEFGPAYLHSGDAIGYYASMVYFPAQKVTITWAVNGNYGKVDEFTQTKDAMNRIFTAVLK